MASKTLPLVKHELSNNFTTSTGSGLSSNKLSTGHYVAARYAMTAVSPRPDTESGPFTGTVSARHRWAYYDGTNAVRYEWPVKVFGGAAPHIYELVTGPAGMTIGNSRDVANHGVVKWTPTQAYTTSAPALVIVRVYGQDITGFVDVAWTIATSSSVSKFVFVDNVNGNDSNPGTISAPFATLVKVTGPTIAATTFPNTICYLRGSATPYATQPHSDHPDKSTGSYPEPVRYRCFLTSTYHPNSIVSFPDENVKIDLANAEVQINSASFALMGSSGGQLTVIGSAVNAPETHNFWLQPVPRLAFSWVTFDSFVPRVAGGWTNACPIFANSYVGNSPRKYGSLHGVQEINRTACCPNDAILHTFFGTDYWVEEYSIASRTNVVSGSGGVGYKDSNYHSSVRYCDFRTQSNTIWAFAFMDQTDGANNEILYSKTYGALWLNYQADADTGNHFVGRCTVWATDSNYQYALRAWAAVGPYNAENCVLIANGPALVHPSITSIGNECHKSNTSGDLPLDSNLNLKNSVTAFRTLYLGTRGAEIV